MNGVLQLQFYADDINLLAEIVHVIKKKTKVVLVASKEIGIEVDAEKSEDIFRSYEQNTGKHHNAKTDNKSAESVEQIGHLETTITNQNCSWEVIRRSLGSVNACYLSVRNLSSHSFQSEI